jgi:hypothetical protein
MKFAKILATVSLLTLGACGSDEKEKTNTSTGTAVSFTTDLKPIIDRTCIPCHASGASLPSGQSLDTEAAFKATKSASEISTGSMPQAPYTLTAEEKAKFATFFAQ